MFLEIWDGISKLIANEDYHHFDSVCYIGIKHSLNIYFVILM